jgi:hypothetical protein
MPCPDGPILLPSGVYGFPEGCPNNPYHMGWYVALLNRLLRRMGSGQCISMINWDSEGNGPIGADCTTFQFLYALRQFGQEADLLPGPGGTPWLLCENGAAGAAVGPPDPKSPCAWWRGVSLSLNPKWAPLTAASGLQGKTFGALAEYVPTPEFYWFSGEDMGNGPVGEPSSKPGVCPATGHNGLLKSLVDLGFLGCPQSAPDKVGFDGNCGCRQTVYEYAAAQQDPAGTLLRLLGPIYQKYTQGKGAIMPTFSIEHLGLPGDMLNFGLCVNSQNFAEGLAAAPKAGLGTCATDPAACDTACATTDKCPVRCGVANFFGNWALADFAAFLAQFAAAYGPNIANAQGTVRLCVYDVGFLPATWFQEVGVPGFTGLPALPNGVAPIVAPTPQQLNQSAAFQGVVDWMTACPAAPGNPGGPPRHLYLCGPDSQAVPTKWQLSTVPNVGNPSPAGMQCFDCTKGCAYAGPGAPGGIWADSRFYQTYPMCEASTKGSAATCGAAASGSSAGAGGGSCNAAAGVGLAGACGSSACPGPAPAPGPAPGPSPTPGPGPGPSPPPAGSSRNISQSSSQVHTSDKGTLSPGAVAGIVVACVVVVVVVIAAVTLTTLPRKIGPTYRRAP